MIELITGSFGSGKSQVLLHAIEEDVRAGRHAWLLVPEQQTVTCEQEMSRRLPPSAPLCFEVSNFTRLANTVFRQVGGLSYRYADAGTRTCLMWRAMQELGPLLHEGGQRQEMGQVRRMAAAMQELRALSLSPGRLSASAGLLPQESHLRQKLEDLSLLSAFFHQLLHQTYGDTTDDLERLADILLERPTVLPSDSHLYIDGFISYTAPEYRVLRALARTFPLTITLDLPAGQEEALCYTETRKTYGCLVQLAAESGAPLHRTDLGESRRQSDPLLRQASRLLCTGAADPTFTTHAPRDTADTTTPPLRVLAAAGPHEAATGIACDIARRVMEEEVRYRDIAIICHTAENYAGILDTALEEAGIPCFMAKRTDITTHAAVKVILSAYAVCTGGWRTGDVIAYLKCGYAGVSQEELDIFETYVTRWQISGRRMTDPHPWNMNPDGYTATYTPRATEILACANRVRERLIEQLSPLQDACGNRTVTAHCRTVYAFLSALSLEDKLAEAAVAARNGGREAEGEELSRLYGVLLDVLDRLVDTMEGVEMDGAAFCDLLRLFLSEVSLSRIPTAIDEVTVGSAGLLRLGQAKHIYLLGVNEGEFPAPVAEGDLFSEADRHILAELGLPVEPDLLLRAAREQFCFARAFSCAQESVTVLYAEASTAGAPLRPAEPVGRLLALLGHPAEHLAAQPPLSLLWRRGTAATYLGLLEGTPEGAALSACFLTDPQYATLCRTVGMPLAEDVCRLSPATMQRLYPGQLDLTQSRMDSYAKCPFSYFCRYVLGLEDDAPIQFDHADIGNLLHTVLERLFASLEEEGEHLCDLKREALPARVAALCERYMQEVAPDGAQRTPRLDHVLHQLQRAATLTADELYEELAQSAFSPLFFELDMTSNAPDAPGTIPLVLADGTRLRLHGRVDRVDVWRPQEGEAYIRVIDYKSGVRRFSRREIARGLHTQLLVYLFSLWRTGNPAFRTRVTGRPDGTIYPAGALYTGVQPTGKAYDRPTDPAQILQDAHRSIYRSGLLLQEERVLRAMDQELKGRFIPVTYRKDGQADKRSAERLSTLEEMETLSTTLANTVCAMGEGILSGRADARPLRDKDRQHICQYCEMKAVCRSAAL